MNGVTARFRHLVVDRARFSHARTFPDHRRRRVVLRGKEERKQDIYNGPSVPPIETLGQAQWKRKRETTHAASNRSELCGNISSVATDRQFDSLVTRPTNWLGSLSFFPPACQIALFQSVGAIGGEWENRFRKKLHLERPAIVRDIQDGQYRPTGHYAVAQVVGSG